MVNVAEEWRPLAGEFSDWSYMVSSRGQVKTLHRGGRCRSSNYVLSPCKSANGYLMVVICRKGLKRNVLVHRLVATAFLGVPSLGEQVNHKNGCKDDNTPENLEWVQPVANTWHAIKTGLRVPSSGKKLSRPGASNGNAKLSEADVLAIHAMNAGGSSMKEIGTKFGVAYEHVTRIISGKCWPHLKEAAALQWAAQ